MAWVCSSGDATAFPLESQSDWLNEARGELAVRKFVSSMIALESALRPVRSTRTVERMPSTLVASGSRTNGLASECWLR